MSKISFAAVSRGSIILATFSPENVDLEKDVQKLLEQPFVKNEQRRMNYYIFSFYKAGNLTFICASPPETNRQIPLSFLELASNRWNISLAERSQTAGPHSLTGESRALFESVLNETNSLTKTEKLKHELEQTQKIVTDSMKMALSRGDELQQLTNHSESLIASSESFKAQSQNLKSKMRCSYYKSLALKVFIALVVVYLLLVFVCGGFRLKPRCL